MTDEDWVSAAMTDDSMVVDLLVQLNHKVHNPPPTKLKPLNWTVRQSRSKTTTLNKPTTSRASPTTPLAWSAASSLSGGVDGGFEQSSSVFPNCTDTMRSTKVSGKSETAPTKRSRKKKMSHIPRRATEAFNRSLTSRPHGLVVVHTLVELRQEEILLLKERRHLKRELATFRINLEKQRATNEHLKRMKLDFQSQPAAERVTTVACEEAISDQFQQKATTCASIPLPVLPPIVTGNNLVALPQPPSSPTSFSPMQKQVSDQETKFVLPDLNLRFDEDLYGVS